MGNPQQTTSIRQEAPFPAALYSLVDRLTYRTGWDFTLRDLDRGQGSGGLTLVINVLAQDSNDQQHTIRVNHYMIVPAASYNEQSWRRWLFEQILLVEQHEAAEFFKIEGERPFNPVHAPGNDPYSIRELATDEERRTNFRGELA